MAAEGFKIADAFVEVHLDQDAVRADAQSLAGGLDPVMDDVGRQSGSKLSQGISQGLIRNSPVIVAAVTAAMAAGAPVAIAGATALFAGIGIVAAAQSEQVKTAWSGTWDSIKQGAQADAAVLVPVLTNAASTIGASFQQMRPLLQDAFAATAPIIDTFVGSVTQAAQNALPGLVNAVQASGPVFDGLGQLIETVGTGISNFFDILAQHAPAAGQAFAAIGDIVGALLPILGELLGAGTELASAVLPPVAAALHIVAGALSAISPVLPLVLGGFLAYKAIGFITPLFQSLSQSMAEASYSSSTFASGAGRISTAVSGLGSALPVIAAGALLVGLNFQKMNSDADAAATALLHGGQAARDAQENIGSSIAGMNASWVDGADHIISYADHFGIMGAVVKTGWDLVTTTTSEAVGATKQSYDQMVAAMSPLEAAQTNVTYWTNEIASAMGDSSYVIQDQEGHTVSLATAQSNLASASSDVAGLQRQLDQAMSGVSRTLEQAATAANELNSALDALNGGQLSMNEAERAFQQAIDDANTALQTNGQNLDINTQAGRDNAAALDSIASSAEDSANAVYKQTGSYDQFTGAMVNGRNALYDAAIAFGMSDQAARAYVDSVLAIPPITSMQIETNSQTVAQELTTLGGQLSGLPQGQALVTWASDEAVQALSALGYNIVGLPNGEVMITATDHATPITQQVIDQILGINNTTGTGTADLNAGPFSGALAVANADFGSFGLRHETPTADLNTTPFVSQFGVSMGSLSTLAAQHPTPIADMNSTPLVSQYGVSMASLATLGSQHPVPTADLNASPLVSQFGVSMSSLSTLGAQRPNPVATMTDNVSAPAGTAGRNLGTLGSMRPNPVATMTDFASGVANSIAAAVNRIPTYRTVTIAVQQVGAALGGLFGAATGGSVDDFMAMATRRDGGGPVTGPGGPTDDLIPALLGGRTPFRLSNGEHVLTAHDVNLMGGQPGVYRFRAALEAGQVNLPWGRARRRDSGGPALDGPAPAASVAAARPMSIEHLHLHVEGAGMDLSRMSDQDMRRFLTRVRDGLVSIERSFA